VEDPTNKAIAPLWPRLGQVAVPGEQEAVVALPEAHERQSP